MLSCCDRFGCCLSRFSASPLPNALVTRLAQEDPLYSHLTTPSTGGLNYFTTDPVWLYDRATQQRITYSSIQVSEPHTLTIDFDSIPSNAAELVFGIEGYRFMDDRNYAVAPEGWRTYTTSSGTLKRGANLMWGVCSSSNMQGSGCPKLLPNHQHRGLRPRHITTSIAASLGQSMQRPA